MKSSADSALLVAPKPQGRSRVSNRSAVLPGVDGRSTWVRRLRDLISCIYPTSAVTTPCHAGRKGNSLQFFLALVSGMISAQPEAIFSTLDTGFATTALPVIRHCNKA
jgi:hypothetical protein